MKRLRLVTTPRAQADVDAHALFIAGDNLDAGLRFLDAIDRGRDELARHPEINRLEIGVIPRFSLATSAGRGAGSRAYTWAPAGIDRIEIAEEALTV